MEGNKIPVARWMNLVTVVIGALLEDLKEQVKDNSSWKTLCGLQELTKT